MPHQFPQFTDHRVEIPGQNADFIGCFYIHRPGQVAAGHGSDRGSQLAQRTRDPFGHEQSGDESQDQGQQRGDANGQAHFVAGGMRIRQRLAGKQHADRLSVRSGDRFIRGQEGHAEDRSLAVEAFPLFEDDLGDLGIQFCADLTLPVHRHGG